MLAWETDESMASGTLAHYQIIRRTGAVVPFEPSKIAEALFKLLVVMRESLAEVERRLDLCKERLLSFLRSISVLKCQIRWCGFDTNRVMLALAAYIQRLVCTGMRKGVGVGRGFFSAAKPNLRNAP